jgi:uncharacterized protein (DUF433 family)
MRGREMPKREVKAKDVVLDIQAGMDDAALMEKYRLTPRGLQNLFDELAYLGLIDQSHHREVKPAKRRISVSQFVTDIRTGLSDTGFMEKYGLSEKGLIRAKRKLVEAGFVAAEELCDALESEGAPLFMNLRQLERYYLDFDLPILDVNAPDIAGKVRDITEQGVGVIGIPAQVGEMKTFLILHKKLFLIKPFLFEARCCWAKGSETDEGFVAGFQITNTSDADRKQLRKLARIVRLFS